jgi:serine/threonine-protein kinase RsbW
MRPVNAQVLAIAPGPEGLSEGRGFIDRALSDAGFDAEARYRITVATNEAVSNAMEHGLPCDDGRLHLATSLEADSFVFSVRDCGDFEDTASPAPDPVAERGRGFAFMNLLMDDVRLDAHPGGTVLQLVKRIPGSPAPDPGGVAGDQGPEENLRVVRELFAAFAARDADRALALVDRGVMFEPLSTPVQRRTPYLGASGLQRYLHDLDETWEEFDLSIEDIRTGGDYVVAFGRIYARSRDVVADDPAAFALRLRDGRVVWAKVYRGQDEALAAAGLD